MNKAMIFPIHKKWVDMIFDGTKKFEFRNKLPKYLVKGMKIYFYETLGKRYLEKEIQQPYGEILGTSYEHEGLGMIVGEAIVGDIYKIGVADRPFYDKTKLRSWSKFEILEEKFRKIMGWKKEGFFTWMPININKLVPQGYNNQQYAIELTNVIKYDEKWLEDKYAYQETTASFSNIDWKHHEQIRNAPSTPIPKENFVSWNKFNKYKKDNPKMEFDYVNNQLYYTWKPEFDGDYNDMFSINKCNIVAPPQAPMYVVEKEE